jgi:hypothetical protein
MVDRVAVSVPHGATWGWARRGTEFFFPHAATGTVHPECTAELECAVPAIHPHRKHRRPAGCCSTNGSEQRCSKWHAETRGAVPPCRARPAADRSTSQGPRPRIHLSEPCARAGPSVVSRSLCTVRVRTYVLGSVPRPPLRRGSRHPFLLDGVS